MKKVIIKSEKQMLKTSNPDVATSSVPLVVVSSGKITLMSQTS